MQLILKSAYFQFYQFLVIYRIYKYLLKILILQSQMLFLVSNYLIFHEICTYFLSFFHIYFEFISPAKYCKRSSPYIFQNRN